MSSLTDHNRRQIELHCLAPDTKLNIYCDECGGELVNPSPNIVLASFPPKIHVACRLCDFTGYAIA